jgi:hypothetical protein
MCVPYVCRFIIVFRCQERSPRESPRHPIPHPRLCPTAEAQSNRSAVFSVKTHPHKKLQQTLTTLPTIVENGASNEGDEGNEGHEGIIVDKDDGWWYVRCCQHEDWVEEEGREGCTGMFTSNPQGLRRIEDCGIEDCPSPPGVPPGTTPGGSSWEGDPPGDPLGDSWGDPGGGSPGGSPREIPQGGLPEEPPGGPPGVPIRFPDCRLDSGLPPDCGRHRFAQI